jgi:hemerythrin
MKQYQYPVAGDSLKAQHIHKHREFSKKVLNMRNDIHDGNKPDTNMLLGFIYDWLLHHIKPVDKDLTAWLLYKSRVLSLRVAIAKSGTSQLIVKFQNTINY